MADQYFSPAKQEPSAIPFRNKFDGARDPLTARNAIGAVDANFVTGAITAAAGDYALDANFPAGAWTAWTPTVTSSSGTITSLTVNTARYTKAGKAITAYFDITISTAGTGAGFLQIPLPVNASASSGGIGFARENSITGVACIGRIPAAGTALLLAKYDGSTAVGTGYNLTGIMVYESV